MASLTSTEFICARAARPLQAYRAYKRKLEPSSLPLGRPALVQLFQSRRGGFTGSKLYQTKVGQMTRDLLLQVLLRLYQDRFHRFHSRCHWFIFSDALLSLFVNDRINSQPIRSKTNISLLRCWYVFSRASLQLHTLRALIRPYDCQLVFVID